MSQEPRILLIEDEAPIRRFLRAALPSHGYLLIEAATGEDGLLQAAMHRPAVIILDLGLPDMDGITVTQQLREWTQIPIIILSARDREHDKVAALDAGADDYLTKPFGMGFPGWVYRISMPCLRPNLTIATLISSGPLSQRMYWGLP